MNTDPEIAYKAQNMKDKAYGLYNPTSSSLSENIYAHTGHLFITGKDNQSTPFDYYLGKVTTSKIDPAWSDNSCKLNMELKDNIASNKFYLTIGDVNVTLKTITIKYDFLDTRNEKVTCNSSDAVRLDLQIYDATFDVKDRRTKLEIKQIFQSSSLFISNTIDDDNKFGSLPKDDKVNVVINRLLQENNAIIQEEMKKKHLVRASRENYHEEVFPTNLSKEEVENIIREKTNQIKKKAAEMVMVHSIFKVTNKRDKPVLPDNKFNEYYMEILKGNNDLDNIDSHYKIKLKSPNIRHEYNYLIVFIIKNLRQEKKIQKVDDIIKQVKDCLEGKIDTITTIEEAVSKCPPTNLGGRRKRSYKKREVKRRKPRKTMKKQKRSKRRKSSH